MRKVMIGNQEDKINNNCINELITELSECREDERNSQNQVVQVISTAGTILGILFGASYFNVEQNNDVIFIIETDLIKGVVIPHIVIEFTKARVLFWLSGLVFCTAFCYIIVLGMSNVLRYHYVQDLEDRLDILIPHVSDDYKQKNSFLHWNSFYAPIITQNPRHINSVYTLLNYGCYLGAIACAILFSVGLTLSQYQNISSKEWYDYFMAGFFIFAMGVAFVLFLRTSVKAKDAAEYSRKVANEQRIKRQNGEVDHEWPQFFHTMRYLIYPKLYDIQKPCLIIVSFVAILLLNQGKLKIVLDNENLSQICTLLIYLFVFDFLAYQARYQINDIRGVFEDKESLGRSRLITEKTKNEKHLIKLSLRVALIKIIAAIGITFYIDNKIGIPLGGCLICLLLITVLYEFARENKHKILIYLTVGLGYPLRVVVGALAVCPEVWKDIELADNIIIPLRVKIFILMALWAYGTFAGILPWVDEVSRKMQKGKESNDKKFPESYAKEHFYEIQTRLSKRYLDAEKHMVGKRVLPLREKGKICDVWNLAYLLSLLGMVFALLLEKLPLHLVLLEIILLAESIFVCIWAKGIEIVLLMIAGWITVVVKSYIAWETLSWSSFYFLVCGIQILFMVTYFLLRYIPQMKKVSMLDLCKVTVRKIERLLVGNKTWNTLYLSEETDTEHLKSEKNSLE